VKTLIILRHAKAEEHRINLDDYDRGLTDRGRQNASEMGEYIKLREGGVDHIFTSSAKRALETALLAAENLHYPAEKISADERLYFAPVPQMLKYLSELPDDKHSCLFVGHNPSLTDLVNYFKVKLDNLPTASAVCFEFDTNSWSNISPKNARFSWIKIPEKYG